MYIYKDKGNVAKECDVKQNTCSQRGVLKTLLLPNRSANPVVQRNTPPKPTSSPNTKALKGKEKHELKHAIKTNTMRQLILVKMQLKI